MQDRLSTSMPGFSQRKFKEFTDEIDFQNHLHDGVVVAGSGCLSAIRGLGAG
jgi:hypothetical protein